MSKTCWPKSPRIRLAVKTWNIAAVAELDRAAQLKPEQQIGDTVLLAEEPDWEALRRQALKQSNQTKDLRVAVILAKASARTQGWPGFKDLLMLLDGLLERFWADLHPRLDEDEPDDFTMRVNLIESLADASIILGYLRDAPLVESVMGRFPLRDCLIAHGELSHPADGEHAAPERAAIDAAIRAADLDAFQQIAGSVDQSLELLEGIESRLMSLVGAAGCTGPFRAVATDQTGAQRDRSRKGVAASIPPPAMPETDIADEGSESLAR